VFSCQYLQNVERCVWEDYNYYLQAGIKRDLYEFRVMSTILLLTAVVHCWSISTIVLWNVMFYKKIVRKNMSFYNNWKHNDTLNSYNICNIIIWYALFCMYIQRTLQHNILRANVTWQWFNFIRCKLCDKPL